MSPRVPTVAPTCPAGFLLNTSNDLCEVTVPAEPTCTIGTLNTVTDECESEVCMPAPPPFFEDCTTFEFGPPDCPTGLTYNTESNLCELEDSTDFPICNFGPPSFESLNPDTDRCEGEICQEPFPCSPTSSSPCRVGFIPKD